MDYLGRFGRIPADFAYAIYYGNDQLGKNGG
jgi:hypothetical protein